MAIDATAKIPATSTTNGAMLAADKAKLDAATSLKTASALVTRDANGAAQLDIIGTASGANRLAANRGQNVPGKMGLATTPVHIGQVVVDPAGWTVPKGGRGFPYGTVSDAGLGDNKNFNGFPSGARLPDGRMFYAWIHASSHGNADGKTFYSLSSDEGNTWTTATELAISISGTPTNIMIDRLLVLMTGTYKNRLLMVFRRADQTPGPFAYTAYSDDAGATWSASVSAKDPASDFLTWCGASMLQLSNGNILLAGYGHLTAASTPYRNSVMQSTDGGASWSYLSTIFDGTATSQRPEEPFLIQRPNGEILCVWREDGDMTIQLPTLRTHKSADSGATWTAVQATISNYAMRGIGRPAVWLFESGTMVCVTRAPSDILATNDTIYYTSHDYGDTWEPTYELVDPTSALFNVYSDFIGGGARNQVGLAYGVQNSGYSLADVRFTWMVDGVGVTPFGSIIGGTARLGKLSSMHASNNWLAPPQIAANGGSYDQLLSFLSGRGLVPYHPLNCGATTGLWELDQVPTTVNDYSSAFTAGDSANTIPALTRLDGSTLSATAGYGGTWGITSNQLYNSASSTTNNCVWDAGKADVTIKVDVKSSGSGQIRLVGRVKSTTTDDLVQLGLDTGYCRIYVGGTQKTNVAGVITSGNWFTAELELVGATINAYVYAQGGTRPSTPTTTYTLTSGEQANYLTPTKHGVGGGTSANLFDNLSIKFGLADNDPLGYIPDLSSAARNLTQATLANKVLWGHVIGAFNGYPCAILNMDQSRYLNSASFTSQPQPNAMCGVFMFHKSNGAFANFLRNANNGNSQNLSTTPAKILQMSGGASGSAGSCLAPWAFTTPAEPCVISSMFDGTNSFLRVNGRYVFKANSSNKPGTSGMTQVQLGDEQQSSGVITPGFWVGAHGTPTVAEVMAIEKYFAEKYDVRRAFEGR